MVASNVHFSHLIEHDKWPGPGQGHEYTSMVASYWDPDLRIINKFIHVSIMFSKSW